MKTFSVLLALACLGVAFMLIGNTADAAPYAYTVANTDGTVIVGVDTRQIDFRLRDLGTNAAVNGAYITFRYAGIEILNVDGNPLDRVNGHPTVNGVVTVNLEVIPDYTGVAYLEGTPVHSRYGASATAFFRAGELDPVKIVVLPPQETLYADGLLEGLPPGFDATWLARDDWVDYCAAAERHLSPIPTPIRLADGPRYHANNTPADASAYQAEVGNLFTAVVEIRDVKDLSAWQMDVAFNPQILRALRVREGNFLAKDVADGWNPFFVPGLMNNDVGVITGIAQARVARKADLEPDEADPLPGVSTSPNTAGILFCIDFQVLEFAEESLGLHNVQLSNSTGARLSYYSVINPVVVTHKFPAEDVNRDRHVGILDLMAVAGAMPPPDGDGGRNLGRANPINPRADVNDDGIINALDLIAVSSHSTWAKYVAPQATRVPNEFVGPTAPALVGNPADITPGMVRGWIGLAQVEDDGSAIFDLGIENLERLLQATVPERTKLLLNYPNPFNPETWIPYQLAKATDVTVSIYSVNGALVRTLALGHQAPGVYQSKSQAAYWDGRNELGEQVASGVYFYTLTAGNFSATGKMLVRK